MWPFRALAESTWGVPILSALHVLGLVSFGGLVLVPREFPRLKRVALVFMVVTGLAVFLTQPSHFAHSIVFWIKLGLIAAAVLSSNRRVPALVLWFGVVLAARLTAFI